MLRSRPGIAIVLSLGLFVLPPAAPAADPAKPSSKVDGISKAKKAAPSASVDGISKAKKDAAHKGEAKLKSGQKMTGETAHKGSQKVIAPIDHKAHKADKLVGPSDSKMKSGAAAVK